MSCWRGFEGLYESWQELMATVDDIEGTDEPNLFDEEGEK
jgi:hypothetical protein